MSRLSEILGVKEGQEFKVNNMMFDRYKVEGIFLFHKNNDDLDWKQSNGTELSWLISVYNSIEIISEKPQLTEQQITAIKGRIAEGTPWAAMDKSGALYAYEEKPKLSRNEEYFYSDAECYPICCDLYDFITFENSPVYLPELVEGIEEE